MGWVFLLLVEEAVLPSCSPPQVASRITQTSQGLWFARPAAVRAIKSACDKHLFQKFAGPQHACSCGNGRAMPLGSRSVAIRARSNTSRSHIIVSDSSVGGLVQSSNTCACNMHSDIVLVSTGSTTTPEEEDHTPLSSFNVLVRPVLTSIPKSLSKF